jgi:hypothetical protein
MLVPFLLIALSCATKHPPDAPTPAPAMAPEINLTFTVESPEDESEVVYPLHCPATPRLPGAEVYAMLDRQREGLIYPRGDGESRFDQLLILPGPYETVEVAVVRQAIGARPAPYFKYDDEHTGWHDQPIGRMLWYHDGPKGSDSSRPAGAFLCTILQQLDGFTELNIGVEHPGRAPGEPRSNTGLYDLWWFGRTIDGAIIGLHSEFSYT